MYKRDNGKLKQFLSAHPDRFDVRRHHVTLINVPESPAATNSANAAAARASKVDAAEDASMELAKQLQAEEDAKAAAAQSGAGSGSSGGGGGGGWVEVVKKKGSKDGARDAREAKTGGEAASPATGGVLAEAAAATSPAEAREIALSNQWGRWFDFNDATVSAVSLHTLEKQFAGGESAYGRPALVLTAVCGRPSALA